MSTIRIISVKIHTLEPLCPPTYGDGRERDAAATTNNTGDTTILDPVSIRVFEDPAPEPLNNESFRVVVAQPMDKMPGRTLSPLTEAGGSVVGNGLAHVMDSSTLDMPPPPPIP